ncbi:MAG TPA: enoyl-CoA hydratase/isomerase family protein [bacterium]|nr:enoyl-CoA hydratase/isomerase family protein [bacterium]
MAESYQTIEISIRDRVAHVALNRPDVRNAFNEVMIEDLIRVLEKVNEDDAVRVLVLTGNGTSFCSGADLNWMKKMKGFTVEENYRDAMRLAELMLKLYSLPKPTIARVNGASIGGSNGLVAACDIVIASHRAEFSLSEVKIGLVPACIGPYLVKRIGEAACRDLFLTGQRISADQARALGLVNDVVTHENLDARLGEKIASLLTSGPHALAVSKELLGRVGSMPLAEAKDYTARMIAELRCGEEAQEGMTAFLEKRRPRWS